MENQPAPRREAEEPSEDFAAEQAVAVAEAPRAGRSWLVRTARFLQVRLRFVAIVAVLFLAMGQWDVLSNYWSRGVRLVAPSAATEHGVSPDTEYFCPMCPGVLSAWPNKCPVCNMPLVRRAKGEATLLPEGVTARMQFSPYRLQLAGVRTSPVEYRELARGVVALGVVRREQEKQDERDEASSMQSAAPGLSESVAPVTVETQLAHWDAADLAPGAHVEIVCRALPTRGPWRGKVGAIEPEVAAATQRMRVQVQVEDPQDDLLPGALVEVRFRLPLAKIEPFRSLAKEPPPLRSGEPRSVYVCPDHRDVVATQPGKCPRDGLELAVEALADNQRLDYWCPMHPQVTALEDGGTCRECQGMKLLPRIVAYAPPGKVLAVPESAVIDTGEHQVVYVETGPGMFDGKAVRAGPSADGFCSILEGLEAGQRVASAGAFLIDAETRLNPHLAAAYFGAAGRPSGKSTPLKTSSRSRPSSEEGSEQAKDYLSKLNLSPADRALAEKQRVCPVTKLPLGSMGELARVESQGSVVFLCCEGCRTQFEKSVKSKDAESAIKPPRSQ